LAIKKEEATIYGEGTLSSPVQRKRGEVWGGGCALLNKEKLKAGSSKKEHCTGRRRGSPLQEADKKGRGVVDHNYERVASTNEAN